MRTSEGLYSFHEEDFQPLEQFPLKWRWTEEKYNVLPPDDLAAIRPLSEAKALQVWRYSAQLCESYENGPSGDLFTNIRHQDASGKAEEVREWLHECRPPDSIEILTSWDNLRAVVTRWDVFCRYWDDFCYPGNDMVIWPVSEAWALVFWHEEQFTFGIRREEK